MTDGFWIESLLILSHMKMMEIPYFLKEVIVNIMRTFLKDMGAMPGRNARDIKA